MRALVFTPLIWVAGFVLVFVGSMIHITPASAEAIDVPTMTATMFETLEPTGTPMATFTPWPSSTATLSETLTSTPIPATQTPRMIYIHNTVVVKQIIPVVVIVVTTPTTGPTQTPWIITVVVTETPSPTPTETPTETTTP